MLLSVNSRGFNSVSLYANHNIEKAEAWWEVHVYLPERSEKKLFNAFPEAAAFYKLASRDLEAITL